MRLSASSLTPSTNVSMADRTVAPKSAFPVSGCESRMALVAASMQRRFVMYAFESGNGLVLNRNLGCTWRRIEAEQTKSLMAMS